MLFYSIAFAVFLPIVFGVYWMLRKSVRWQNEVLLLASYVSYAYWDWRFWGLLLGMSLFALICGKMIAKSTEGLGGGAKQAIRR